MFVGGQIGGLGHREGDGRRDGGSSEMGGSVDRAAASQRFRRGSSESAMATASQQSRFWGEMTHLRATLGFSRMRGGGGKGRRLLFSVFFYIYISYRFVL